MSKHLFAVHSSNERVSDIRLLTKRSKERSVRLELLTNEGNFKHNVQVMKTGSGSLVVGRRVSQLSEHSHNPMDYLPCEFCFKFVVNTYLWHHVKMCKIRKFFHALNSMDRDEESETLVLKEDNEDLCSNFTRHGRTLLYSAVYGDNEPFFVTLLERMQDGVIKEIVANDVLIRTFASLQVESLGDVKNQKLNDIHRVSSGARTLARLIIEVRKVIPFCNLDTILQPKNFDAVVNATKNLSLNSEKESLTLGPKIGFLLGHAILCKSGLAIKSNNQQQEDDARKFKILFDVEWNVRVNSVLRKKKIR